MDRSRNLIMRRVTRLLSRVQENREISQVRGLLGTFNWKFCIVPRTYRSSSIRNAPKHKTSQRTFLFWVAYVRERSQNLDETERRTCPLKDCEEPPFETLGAMLQHVQTCPRLAKGSYKCCDCRRFERISRIHNNGCHEHRFSMVAKSSLRRAKRLLSSHGPKNRNGSENAMGRQTAPGSMAELPTPAELSCDISPDMPENFTGFAAELDTFSIPEIYGLEMPAEFATYDRYLPYGEMASQESCSELSAGHDSAYVSDLQLCTVHVPVELDTFGASTRMIVENGHLENSRPALSSASDAPERTYGNYSSQTQADDRQHLLHERVESAGHHYTSYDRTRLPEIRSPVVSPISPSDYPTCFSFSNPGSSRTNTEVSALSFGSFSTSRDTSMSSVSSSVSQVGHYKQRPVRFFEEEEEGGANLLFSEPESLDDSIEPVELPTCADTYALNYFGEESNSMFSEPESIIENPVEAVELPTSYSLTYFEERSNLICSEPEFMVDSVKPAELPTSSNVYFASCFENGPSLMPVELPTPFNAYSHHFKSPASIPRSLSLLQRVSDPARPRDIEAQHHPKRSPRSATTHSDPSSPPPIANDTLSKYKCHCGHEPSGKEVYKSSNLKRHQETTKCRRYLPYRRPDPPKLFQCPFPGCDKDYTRSDNLRAHQKKKRHFLEVELLRTSSLSRQPESDALRDFLDRHRYQEDSS
jgi:hypothetical protein